jgi:hypothetical protein
MSSSSQRRACTCPRAASRASSSTRRSRASTGEFAVVNPSSRAHTGTGGTPETSCSSANETAARTRHAPRRAAHRDRGTPRRRERANAAHAGDARRW